MFLCVFLLKEATRCIEEQKRNIFYPSVSPRDGWHWCLFCDCLSWQGSEMGRQTPPFCWEDPAEAVLRGLCPSRVGVGHQAPTLPLSLPCLQCTWHTHIFKSRLRSRRFGGLCLLVTELGFLAGDSPLVCLGGTPERREGDMCWAPVRTGTMRGAFWDDPLVNVGRIRGVLSGLPGGKRRPERWILTPRWRRECMLSQHVNPGHGAQVRAVWSCTPHLCSHPSNHDHTMNPVLICWRCLPLTPGSVCGGISLGSPWFGVAQDWVGQRSSRFFPVGLENSRV